MPLTFEEIAKANDFSAPPVSHALTNNNYPVTSKRILEVTAAMGAQPPLSGRSFGIDRANTIGIIVDDLLSPFVPNYMSGVFRIV